MHQDLHWVWLALLCTSILCLLIFAFKKCKLIFRKILGRRSHQHPTKSDVENQNIDRMKTLKSEGDDMLSSLHSVHNFDLQLGEN